MLATLLIWSCLLVLLFLYGFGTVGLLDRWLKAPILRVSSLPLILLLGLILFGTLAAALSLFIGLNWLAAFLLLAGGLLLFFLACPSLPRMPRAPSGYHWLPLIIILLAGLILLENTTHAPANPDTNLYHAQTIHWIESYPAVPGLGNLNGRLAYNSDWLVINAATSLAFLQLRSFHLVAGLLFLIAALYFAEGLFGLARRPLLLSNWLKVLFLPLSFRILVGEVSSPGTDLPVILLTWVLMALAVESLEAPRAIDDPDVGEFKPLLVGILPAFIVTLKLSAAPLLLLSAWMFFVFLRQRAPRQAWTLVALALLVLLPWLARSAILSGYLVFPYSRLDLFHFDWKIPASYVDSVRNGVIGWARLPNKDWTVAVHMPLQSWLPAWFVGQTRNQQLMIAAAILSPLVLLQKDMRRFAVPLVTNYIGIWFWIFSAPNLRFGYGFLLTGLAFVGAAILVLLAQRLGGGRARSLSFAAGGVLFLVLAYTLFSTFDSGTLQRRLLLPLDYGRFHTVPCAAGTLQLQCASAYKQCGYDSFPCVPNVPMGVLPRGSSLQDGFYSTK